METQINRIVHEFERGRLSRRELVARLGVLFALAGGSRRLSSAEVVAEAEAKAETERGLFEATELNHIALRVTDVARSQDFYIKYLGLKLSREGANNAFLTCGKNFVALFRGDTAGMDHYCYSVKDYDVAVAEEKLTAGGLSNIRRTGDRIYFSDPDDLTVQLAASGHQPT